ncbi:MAG: transcriptional regulator [Dehalococcoidia bacterium]
MAGHKKFRDLVAHIDADPIARAEIEAEKRAMEDIIALAELRERRAATLSADAGAFDNLQPSVVLLESQIDGEGDIYLSTLRYYVEALGGRLEITAVFPDESIRLVPATIESESAAGARS